MTVGICQVYWYPQTNPTGVPVDMSYDVLGLSVRRGKDITTNQFKIRLRNTPRYAGTTLYGDWIDVSSQECEIKSGDIIKIWINFATSSESFDDDNFLMTGVVQVPNVSLSDSTSVLEIEGTDNSYVLLNKIWPKSYNADTPPNIVIDIVKSLTSSSYGDGTYGISASLVSAGGYVEGTRKATYEDGGTNTATTFPSRAISNYMKPAYTYIDTLSSPDFTNTEDELAGTASLVYSRNFMWYIDENKNFHWFYPDDGSDMTFTVGTDDVMDYQLKRTKTEAFNMVIWNAGEDDTSVAMQGYLFNYNTTESDLKIKYLPFTDIGREYRDKLGQTGNTLRANVQKAVEGRINQMFSIGARDVYRGTLSLRGGKYNVGDVLTLVDTARGINNDFRINEVTYQIDGGGISTILNIEEDATKLINRLTTV